jgi:hypothetical protein
LGLAFDFDFTFAFGSPDFAFGSPDFAFGSLDFAFGSPDFAFGSPDFAFDSLDFAFDSLDFAFDSLDLAFDSLDLAFDSLDFAFGSLDLAFDSLDALLVALVSGPSLWREALEIFFFFFFFKPFSGLFSFVAFAMLLRPASAIKSGLVQPLFGRGANRYVVRVAHALQLSARRLTKISAHPSTNFRMFVHF